MQIEQADIDKFKRLGLHTCSELALQVPARFEDHRLHPRLLEGEEQAIDATVERVSRSPRAATITLYVHNFGHAVDGVLFNPKPYMLQPFRTGERGLFFGRISCKEGRCQMHHPKPITHSGTLTPKYKTVLRTDSMASLVARYVTLENLRAEKLPEAVAAALLALHFPQEAAPKSPTAHQLYALKYTELFCYMRQLKGKRRYFPSRAALHTDWRSWAMGLPFMLTDEQVAAIEAVEADLKKPRAARRMIVGDVGAGKTMVILAAMQIARPHRSILMAPTTLLANQLFEEAKTYLPELAIVLVTNRTSKKLDLDTADILVGTHALLHRTLPEAALVMVDEQHRFGTTQRHRLEKQLMDGAKRPHYLQFSATPIPRTQAMIDSAHIDVSLITKTPFKKDVTTTVIHKKDFADLIHHIRGEIAQSHQVLLVYPLVEESELLAYQSIEEARGYWEKHFEHVYVTHGKDRDKEHILEAFKEAGNLLLATTVVEVGISLPRLTTVVIVGAERLGLATLHQLRGRVSRNGLKGWCYLYSNQNGSERLDAFCSTDNGFDIATLDLKFRKSGDLLTGSIQSGKKFQWADMAEDEAIVSDVKKALGRIA